MRKLLNSCAFIVALLLPFGSQSQTMSGNDLLEKLPQKDAGALYYLVGVVDGAAASKNLFVVNPSGMSEQSAKNGAAEIGKLWGCRPEKATYGQVVDITVAYLKKRPEVRHLDATLLIAFAMKEAWPC